MLGRFWKVKGPGLIILIPGIQQMVRVDQCTMVMDVQTAAWGVKVANVEIKRRAKIIHHRRPHAD